MFVELGAFYSEKESYNQRVEDIKAKVTDPNLLARHLEEERLKFKGITRRYLAPALAVIKEMFGVDYSLYKVGRDVDANFKTIETTIHKTQTEIANDMNQFVEQANSMNLDEYKSNRVNIAIDVIMSYVDDAAVVEDENKSFFLNHTKVVASSVDLPVTKKENSPVNQPVAEPVHNPYANQPVNLNEGQGAVSQPSNTNNTLVDPFASIYGGAAVAAGATASTLGAASTNEPSVAYPTSTQSNLSYQPPQGSDLYQIAPTNSTNTQLETNKFINETPVNSLLQPAGSEVQNPSNVQTEPATNIFGEQAKFIQASLEPANMSSMNEPVPSPFMEQPTTNQFIQPPQGGPQFDATQQFSFGQTMTTPVVAAPQFGTNQQMSSSQAMTTPVVAPPQFEVNQQMNVGQAMTTPVVAAPQVVMPDIPAIKPKNNALVGTEKMAVVMQLLSTILIPILTFISAAILYFIFELDVVDEFRSNMPEALTSFAICLVIVTVCLILSGPIIALAKRCTGYIERFLIAPALLSIPTSYFAMQWVSKIEISSTETALQLAEILLLAVMIYFIFVTLLFFRGFVNSNNNPNVKAPRWTIFDILGMLLVLYTIMIPAVYLTCNIIGVDIEIINKAIETIYFTNNPDISQYMDKVFLIVAPVVAALGMILRTILIFVKNKKNNKKESHA